jgi:hypothetical protein
MATLPLMTLAEIRTACQQRADMVGSSFVSSSEWTSYINNSLFELYDLLVQKYGADYYVKQSPTAITTDGTNDKYALASDFYKLLGVDLLVSGSGATAKYISLRPFAFAERNDFSGPGYVQFCRTNLRYRLNGAYLWFAPFPPSGLTLRPQYVPRMTALSAEGDTSDGISGWLEYVIVDAAMKALQKEESDVSVLMAEKQMLIQRIESTAANRDAGNPATVADVTSDGSFDPTLL